MPDAPKASQENCPACGAVVNVADAEPLASIACPQCGEDFRVQTVFDNFVLVETLGVGGMGSVYKARDTHLDRFVALKLLRKDLNALPAETARLEEEARVTAGIDHPNVVRIYTSGTAHGRIYLVMELVDHGSLDDLMVQQARLSERQVLETGIQVARGLEAAHEKGLIHRDVKPANILFSDARTAKIGDFGLAGVAEPEAAARSEIWATPYYVAPERLNNDPEDFRSDIYSLGATLFHALAGRPPMEGETTSASELRELKNHPPSLNSIAPEVSRATAQVIDRMIAPQPKNRFESHAQLIRELRHAYRALPRSRGGAAQAIRSRGKLMISVAAVLLAMASVGIYFWRFREAAPPRAQTTTTPAGNSALSENAAALQQRYEGARQHLIDGHLEEAATAFAGIAQDAQDQQSILNWSRLHLALTALLEGNVAQARATFAQIEAAGPFSNAEADANLARFFVQTAEALAAPGPIRGTSAVDGKSVDAFALLLFGLKNWQLREFDEAAGLLSRFERAEPPNEFSWFNDYKPIARQYLQDYALYSEAKKLPQRFQSAAKTKAVLEKIRALEKRVQTRGALVEALRKEEDRVSRDAASLQKTEKQARERRETDQGKKTRQKRSPRGRDD